MWSKGRRLDNARYSGYGRFFLLGLLLPRRQVDRRSAEYAFCYGCAPATLGQRFQVLSELVRRIRLRAVPLLTERALVGLFAYNVFFLVAGAGVLWGIRGWRAWTELVRLAGLAYFLGVGSLMVLMTFELTVGIPVTVATILLDGALLVAVPASLRRISRRSLAASLLAGGLAVPRPVGVRRAVPRRDRRLSGGNLPVGAARRRRERVRQLGVLGAEGRVDLLVRGISPGDVLRPVAGQPYPRTRPGCRRSRLLRSTRSAPPTR